MMPPSLLLPGGRGAQPAATALDGLASRSRRSPYSSSGGGGGSSHGTTGPKGGGGTASKRKRPAWRDGGGTALGPSAAEAVVAGGYLQHDSGQRLGPQWARFGQGWQPLVPSADVRAPVPASSREMAGARRSHGQQLKQRGEAEATPSGAADGAPGAPLQLAASRAGEWRHIYARTWHTRSVESFLDGCPDL
eukprot:COSAG01_NODE_17376_length_1156_cov_1.931883_1_plen_192_part_00